MGAARLLLDSPRAAGAGPARAPAACAAGARAACPARCPPGPTPATCPSSRAEVVPRLVGEPMSARDEILARVARALVGRAAPEAPEESRCRATTSAPARARTWSELLADRLVDYKAMVHEVDRRRRRRWPRPDAAGAPAAWSSRTDPGRVAGRAGGVRDDPPLTAAELDALDGVRHRLRGRDRRDRHDRPRRRPGPGPPRPDPGARLPPVRRPRRPDRRVRSPRPSRASTRPAR